MKIERKLRVVPLQRYLCLALLTAFLSACEKRETQESKEPFTPVIVPFEVVGPELSYNDSILITGYESNGRVEKKWSIKVFSSTVLARNERKWRISLQSKENYTEKWIQHLRMLDEKNLDKYREWGMSNRIDMPAEYLNSLHEAFEDFIIAYDKAKGKDLGDDRIPMVNIDDLKINFLPGGVLGHKLYVEYYNALHVFYDYGDVKAYLKLLEKRPEISRMRRNIDSDAEQRDLEVGVNIDEIFGGR